MSKYKSKSMENIDYKGYAEKNKYVDFSINGRLFPTWIMANFKKYTLPPLIKSSTIDPCKQTSNEKTKTELRKYQMFLSSYLSFNSPYRDILIYHGLGTGKTASTINIINTLYDYTPGWNVFIMIKAALKTGWLNELKKWLSEDEKEFRMENIVFVHYDSPFADRQFMDIIKNVDNSKKSLYVIDEVHNFIRNVYSNISSEGGKRAQKIYDYIIQDKKENPDTRIIAISGTPAINSPYEIALLFNMFDPNTFPKSESEFNQIFITNTPYVRLNPNRKNLFQRRIMGKISYYEGSDPAFYASQTTNYVDVPMSAYQQEVYTYYEEIEIKQAMRTKGKDGTKMYKSYTRQACNFVFPVIGQRITGETRPRPTNFRITEFEAIKITEERELKGLKADVTGKILNVAKYKQAMKTFIDGFDNYLNEKNKIDKKNKHTIMVDIKTFKDKYNSDFINFNLKEKKKSLVFDAMYMSSAKMVNIIFNIMNSEGPVLVYSNYVAMEGLTIFKIYLKYVGFYNYMDTFTISSEKGQVGYVEYHGGIKDRRKRDKGMNAFNKKENKLGEVIKIMLVSPAGSEGLNLLNVRQVHIMEPYWNEVRIIQMVGRAIRMCSHKDLDIKNRHVDIYRYKSVRRKKDSKWTTDQIIEDLARSKDSKIQSFLDPMKEVAIDCNLNKEHNMSRIKYKCFQFNEPTLFNKYPGPSYKKDIYDDMKLDNGLNSMRSKVVRIRVKKIKAVIQLSSPEKKIISYSKPTHYWYYNKSRVVYDFKMHYPYGKVGIDENNIPLKLDKDTYIINRVIPIPMLVD